MDLLLQIWGGGCYLSNKALFAIAESRQADLRKRLRILGWLVYIIGVPAWVIILVGHDNWIAASIEAGGIPAMLLGLYNTMHDHQRQHRWFNHFVSFCTWGSLVFGVAFSVWDNGGLGSLSQMLEMGVMVGFLMGSYLLARGNPVGWLMFMLMNLSMSTLMGLQDKHILMIQQLVSLCFVIYGFRTAMRQRTSLA